MFDPVFELGFILFVWAAVGIPTYWITKNWLRPGSPVIMAVFVPPAGMMGFFGINAFELIPDGTSFVVRMAVDAASAIFCIAIIGIAVSYFGRRLRLIQRNRGL